MLKKNFAFLLLCLFFVIIVTSACGDGGKTTPPNNSAFYYLLAQQNANNNEQEQQNEPTPDPSPTPDPEPVNPFADAQVGNFVEFGHYRQTGDGDNVEEWEAQPIEWQVLSVDTANNRVLAISRYGLDAKRFDNDSNVWAESEICTWLNGDFYNTAFNETEKGFIKPVDIVFNDDDSDNYDFDGSTYNVFLLSKEEAEKYFANADARRCEATDYAVKNGAYVPSNGYSYWWLRSPDPDFSDIVYIVYNFGFIYSYNVLTDSRVVRPALWINLNN